MKAKLIINIFIYVTSWIFLYLKIQKFGKSFRFLYIARQIETFSNPQTLCRMFGRHCYSTNKLCLVRFYSYKHNLRERRKQNNTFKNFMLELVQKLTKINLN